MQKYQVIVTWINGDASIFSVSAENGVSAENQVITGFSGTVRDNILTYWVIEDCDHSDLDNGICLECGFDQRGELLADRIDAAKDRTKDD